ncbi:WD40-repeat-containing domain protein [Tylopilus felleus]
MTVPITITADEVNCLIHAYFQDSGFQHSAFSLRMEGRLDHSHHIKKHIPRGELLERLSKSLLYAEVEAHYKGDSFAKNCKSGFSLLERHVCSFDSNAATLLAPQQSGETNIPMLPGETNVKRKSISPCIEDGRAEKRARKEAEEAMVADGTSITFDSPSNIAPNEAKVPDLQQPSSEKKPKSKRLDPVRLLQAHKAEVFVVAWSPTTAGQLVSGSRDATVNYWNVPLGPHGEQSPRPTLTLSNLATSSQADLTSIDWSPDGSLVAIGSYDATLRIYTSAGKGYLTDDHHKGPIFAAKFSPSGQWVATASLDSTSCVWDIKNKRLYRQYRNHEEACCLDVDWIDDSTFASGGSDRVVHIVSLNGMKPIQTLKGHEGELNMLKCNPSRTRLATCSDDATARIWNIEHVHSEKPISTAVVLKGHKRWLTSIKWCPNNQAGERELVATASFDCTARLWDSVTGDCLKVFTDHTNYVFALSFSPDGSLLASGGGDGTLVMYDVKTRERTWTWSCGEKTGIFEIDWKKWGEQGLIALAMEHKVVVVKRPTILSALPPYGFSRTLITDAQTVTQTSSQDAWKKFAITAAAVAGTVVVAEGFLNRDTRDSLTAAEQSYLHDSFKYTGGGLVLTALAARSMFKSGVAFRVMSANPWLVLGVSLVGSIGSMMGVYYTPPERTVQKHLFWLATATLSPLFFLSPAILSRAALYTCGVVGSLSYVGATAKRYLYMGGPLLAGVTVVALSSLAPMALPLGIRGLAIAESISLYGGLAVFGGFVLYDTQKILQHARMAEMGVIPRDPMKEAISLELDMINIFIRLVQILTMRSNNRK